MRLISAVTCAWVVLGLGDPARAQPWSRPLVCQVNPEGTRAAMPPARSVRWDRSLRELEEFGEGRPIHGRRSHHRVVFTFDDGPRHGTTPKILDALDRYDVPATFFVVGWRFAGDRAAARKNATVLHEIVERGYHIGNHTFSHKRLSAVPPAIMRQEIDRNTLALTEHLGYIPHAFRPPYGAMNRRSRAHVRAEGFTVVRWSIDTHDFWAGTTPGRLRRRTVERIIEQRGGVVLMHDTKEATVRALPGILDDLERENCRRLARGERLIVPVSLHYFMTERDGTPRPVPARVEARTRRYRDRLPDRCRARKRDRRTADRR